jgi:hypothetical protein
VVVELGIENGSAPTVGEQILVHDVATKLGTYAAGLPVRVLRTTRYGRAVVCLDGGGYHPGGRCHVASLPRSWLAGWDVRIAGHGLWRPEVRQP